jgi:outer membrane protein assembly factor BamB
MAITTNLRRGWAAAVLASALTGVAGGDCGGGCGGGLSGTPADEFVAERMGLVREWVAQVPFDSARADLEHVVVGDGLVVAQTGDGGVHAFAAAPFAATTTPRPGAPAIGSLLWSRTLGAADGPTTVAGIGPRLVTVARDLELFAVDRDTGAARWRQRLGRLPGGGAVEISDWVYALPSGGGIRRLTFDPLQPTADESAPVAVQRTKPGTKKAAKKAIADAKPTAESLRPRTFDSAGPVERPVRALGKGIAWTTNGGVLVTLQPTDVDWDRFEFALNSPAVDTPITRGDAVFAATTAADLARVDFVESGSRGLRTGWHVVLDAVPDAGPFLGGDTLVVSLGESGLAAFSAETGAALWRSPVAGRVLAVVGDRVWIIDRTGRLAGIDLATGERRERLCLGGFSFPVVNAESDRLILASPDGLLAVLAPRKPVTPPAAKPAKPLPAAPQPAEAAEAAAAN